MVVSSAAREQAGRSRVSAWHAWSSAREAPRLERSRFISSMTSESGCDSRETQSFDNDGAASQAAVASSKGAVQLEMNASARRRCSTLPLAIVESGQAKGGMCLTKGKDEPPRNAQTA